MPARLPIYKSEVFLSDLSASPGQVVARPEITILKRPSCSLAAGVFLQGDPAIPDSGKYVLVHFHFGQNQWACIIESMAQKCPEFHFGSLKDCMAKFAAVTGMQPPPIKVTELGVGIYDAASDPASGVNPWKMEHGDIVEVWTRRHGARQYVVLDTPRGQELSRVENGIRDTFSFCKSILDEVEWRTFRRIGSCGIHEGPIPLTLHSSDELNEGDQEIDRAVCPTC